MPSLKNNIALIFTFTDYLAFSYYFVLFVDK